MSEAVAYPSSSKTRRYLAEIRDRAAKTFAEVKQYRGRPVADVDVTKLFDSVTALVNYAALGWDPCKDPSVRNCVDELREILEHTSGERIPKRMLKARWNKLARRTENELAPKHPSHRRRKAKKAKNLSSCA